MFWFHWRSRFHRLKHRMWWHNWYNAPAQRALQLLFPFKVLWQRQQCSKYCRECYLRYPHKAEVQITCHGKPYDIDQCLFEDDWRLISPNLYSNSKLTAQNPTYLYVSIPLIPNCDVYVLRGGWSGRLGLSSTRSDVFTIMIVISHTGKTTPYRHLTDWFLAIRGVMQFLVGPLPVWCRSCWCDRAL